MAGCAGVTIRRTVHGFDELPLNRPGTISIVSLEPSEVDCRPLAQRRNTFGNSGVQRPKDRQNDCE